MISFSNWFYASRLVVLLSQILIKPDLVDLHALAGLPPRGSCHRWQFASILFLSAIFHPVAWGDVYKFIGQGGEVFYTPKIKSTPQRHLMGYAINPSRYSEGSIEAASRSKYADLILKIATIYELDPQLLHAVIQAESAYDPFALS